MKRLSKGGLFVKRYLKPDPARYFQQGGVQNFSNARLADAKTRFAGDYSEKESAESLSSSGISYRFFDKSFLQQRTMAECKTGQCKT